MPITKDCTVKGFEGKVTFYQPLNMEQVIAYEDAQDAAAEAEPSALLSALEKAKTGEDAKITWASRQDKEFLPAVLKCVEKFEIPSLPADMTAANFPMTPRTPTHEFIVWLANEIGSIYQGEISVPNES